MPRRVKTPTDLPADAFGFIAVRADRQERPALYGRDGMISATFAFDASDADIAATLANGGLRLDGNFVFTA